MKGIDIVVKGSVGHMSAFMAQAGNLVVLGDAGEALGRFDLRSASLCARQGERAWVPIASKSRWTTSTRTSSSDSSMPRPERRSVDVGEFKRYGSARQLYHFHVENVGPY